MANYNFVIDSSFKPFSFQEMLTPWVMYGNAYEKVEDEYDDLTDKADAFKYLSETLPEDSKARKLYEGYANDLKVQAEDLVKNGLNIRNRKALSSLRKRYQGEIGRLSKADEALRAEKKLRRDMSAKDSSMLYAVDNLGIDDFLDENMPNTYGISGNELYARGAQAGKAASSRMYEAGDEGSTLGGYYRKWTERMGVSPESIGAFMNSEMVQQEVDNILAGRGASQNLSGVNLERARQEVLNGIYDGIVYQESVKPMRDEGVMSASAQAQYDLQREQMVKNAAASGLFWDDEKRGWVYDESRDPVVQRTKAKGNNSSSTSTSGSSGSGSGGSGKTAHFTQGDKPIRIQWKGNDPAEGGDVAKDYEVSTISSDAEEEGYVGNMYDYDELPSEVQKIVDKRIGRGNAEYYEYYFKPFERGAWNGFWDDTEAALDIVPKKIVTDDSVADALAGLFGLQ